MARIAAADGIEVVAATPHIRHDHDVRIPELPARVEELNEAIDRNRIPVEVVSGGELAETALEGLRRDELRAVSLAGQGWILLEPRPGPLGQSLIDAVDHLEQEGFYALIAHPERHVWRTRSRATRKTSRPDSAQPLHPGGDYGVRDAPDDH
jgi:protein-tyrosine phosphatase